MSKSVRFYSKCPNYTILRKATMLEVNNGIPLVKHGEKIEFEHHEYVTSDPGMIKFLRGHKACGVDFVEDKPDVIPGGKEAVG